MAEATVDLSNPFFEIAKAQAEADTRISAFHQLISYRPIASTEMGNVKGANMRRIEHWCHEKRRVWHMGMAWVLTTTQPLELPYGRTVC